MTDNIEHRRFSDQTLGEIASITRQKLHRIGFEDVGEIEIREHNQRMTEDKYDSQITIKTIQAVPAIYSKRGMVSSMGSDERPITDLFHSFEVDLYYKEDDNEIFIGSVDVCVDGTELVRCRLAI